MITYKEYRFLKKIEKDNLSEEMLDYSVQPEFILRLQETIVLDRISKNENKDSAFEIIRNIKDDKKEMKKHYTKKVYNNFRLISRLLDRGFIEIHEKTINGKNRGVVRFFRITSDGYNVMIDYRNSYKYWIPLILSIISIMLSLLM